MRGFMIKDKNCKKEIYYFNFESNSIIKSKIKDVDSVSQYYSPDIEKALAEIEAKFGNIAYKIKNFLNNSKNEIIVSYEYRNLVRIFFDLLFLRNSIIMTNTLGINHETALKVYLSEEQIEPMFFSNYYPLIVYNLTNRDFLLPRCVLYIAEHDSVPQYVCPLNSKTAVVMVNKEEFDNHVKNNYLEYGKINDENVIENMNLRAYYSELETSGKYIFGSKEELKKLMENIIN
jgi:hypothetical protein